MKATFRSFAVLALLAAAACSKTQERGAARQVSPLVGSWSAAGAAPAQPKGLPTFTQLRFERDGTLEASYQSTGQNLGLSGAPTRQETDKWAPAGDGAVRITEGSRELDYRYVVNDDRLELTPPGGSAATVFSRMKS